MDKLAPGGNMRNGTSKIQQYDFLVSLLVFKMDLWLVADLANL